MPFTETVEIQLETMTGRMVALRHRRCPPRFRSQGDTGWALRCDIQQCPSERGVSETTGSASPRSRGGWISGLQRGERPKGRARRFFASFSLGLAKWLLSLAHGWELGHADTPSIIAIPQCLGTTRLRRWRALRSNFLPPPRGLLDRFGVARAQPAPDAEREDASVRAVDKIRRHGKRGFSG